MAVGLNVIDGARGIDLCKYNEECKLYRTALAVTRKEIKGNLDDAHTQIDEICQSPWVRTGETCYQGFEVTHRGLVNGRGL